MKISEKIGEKLGRKLAKQVNLAQGHAIAKKIENDRIVYQIMKYGDVIGKVIDDYGFAGQVFNVEFLPVIMAMTIEEFEKQKRKENALAQACLRADVRHF